MLASADAALGRSDESCMVKKILASQSEEVVPILVDMTCPTCALVPTVHGPRGDGAHARLWSSPTNAAYLIPAVGCSNL